MGSICDTDPKFGNIYYYIKGEEYLIENAIETDKKYQISLKFFLNKIVNPNQMHSFSISLLNNTDSNKETFLGDLEERSGQEIFFKKEFIIIYYFWRNNFILIAPKMNGNLVGNKKKINLNDLIIKGDLNIIFEGIGNLIISFKKSEEYYSSFQFIIELKNKIFDTPKNIQNIYFNIYISDNNEKKALYKSQEFSTNNFSSNIINLDNKYLSINEKGYTHLYIAFCSPNLSKKMPIGYVEFYLRLEDYNVNNDIIMTSPIKSSKYENFGNIRIKYNKKIKYNFLDYLKIGTKFNLSIAIDYTASNNSDSKPLHNIDPKYPNDYEILIKSFGNILASYNCDKSFSVYGFGGIPRTPNNSNKLPSHCFNVNFQENPNIKGVENVIKFYRESLSKVTLAGPTYFSHVIEKVVEKVKYDIKNKKNENIYYILLILTDGICNDVENSIDKIFEASFLPISIIIVGIGADGFLEYYPLEGDVVCPVVNSKGEKSKRVIIGFYEFERYKKYNDINYMIEEALNEMLKQVEEYNKIYPKSL